MKLLLLATLGALCVAADRSQDAIKEFVTGNTLFTADVYAEMKSRSGNFLVCPLSANVILALARAGATGQTAQELSTGLHLPDSTERIEQIFKAVTPHLHGNKKYTLSSANKVYIKNGYGISDSFRSTAGEFFNAEVQNIDFEREQQAAAEINAWVAEKTQNKIRDLISPDVLNEDTFAVLINAIYFHGQWVTRFNEERTRKRPFYAAQPMEMEVDMMDVTSNFNYYESAELNAKFLEMPYEGGAITMNIVLPNDVRGLPALEARIADVLAAPKYSSEEVHVELPKFKTETSIDFNSILKARGITRAFRDNAEFTEIGSAQNRINISKVLQKAFIEVDEKGTTAAAATAVVMEFSDLRVAPLDPPPKQFIANHPFIYYLKSSSAGIMFIGRFSEA